MERPTKKKWSLWRPALVGRAITSCVFAINILAHGTEELSPWLNAPTGQMIAYFAGRLLWLPLLLVVFAFVRNLFVRTEA